MDPDLPDLTIADVVVSTAGRDAGSLFYVLETDGTWLALVNGKDRSIEKPKRKKSKHTRKVLRSESSVVSPSASARCWPLWTAPSTWSASPSTT